MSILSRSSVASFGLLATLLLAPGLAAQDANGGAALLVEGNPNDAPRPQALAVRTDAQLDIDGRLDEAAWQSAPLIDRFVQQRPRTGAAATERTEVRILYDDTNLYVGADLLYADPSQIVRTGLLRDANTAEGDAFAISLDTFLDGRTGFVFFVNPGGALRDAQTADDGRVRNLPWNSAGRVETFTHDRGWSLELVIPWSTLRFEGSREQQLWGMHLFRRIRHNNEEVSWAPMDRGWTVYNVSRSGHLSGIEGISPGRNLSLKPYVVSTRSTGALTTEAETDFDAGADLKYGITSGITLDLTVNTDFSQAEVDRPQVNLTRFSLFFPEQREFFLENESLFQFGELGAGGAGGGGGRTGVSNRDFTLFHSRSIGLRRGTPLPILGGARITGTAGPISLGVLNMQTREFDEISPVASPENFTVVRVRDAISPDLTVGGIFANRVTTSGDHVDNQSYGVDVDFTAFNDYLLLSSYLAGTQGTNADGSPVDRALAGRFLAHFRSPFWEFGAMYRALDEDFAPAMGFVSRTGIEHLHTTFGIRPVVDWGVIEGLNPFVETHHFQLLDGGMETRELGAGLGLEFIDGSNGNFDFADHFERVHEPFEVGDAEVPAGDYDFRDGTVSYGTSGGRPLSVRMNVGGGGYYNGDRFTLGGGVLGRVGDRMILDISAEHNRITLPGQAVANAAAYSGRLQWFFSTMLVGTALLQYDETAHELVSNLRLKWEHAPLSDLFLVLSDRRDTQTDQVLERLVTLKVTRLLPF